MRFSFFCFILLSFPMILHGQEAQPEPPKPQLLKSVNSELVEATKFLDTVPEVDRPYIRFFTTYAVPSNERLKVKPKVEDVKPGEEKTEVDDDKVNIEVAYSELVVFALNYVIHSLSSGQVFAPVKQITDTLFWIDIRDYGWTEIGCEKVAQLDPYFREPLVDHTVYSNMRIKSGNAIIRADWFITHATNTAKQFDRGIEDIIYYELLYGYDEEGKSRIPKNIDDFRKFWGFDIDKLIQKKLCHKTVIKKGQSPVAIHNRDLARFRTENGYYWQTMDIKSMVGNRNYIENLHPDLRKDDVDAGEVIASNYIGLQVYLLINGKGDRVDFADNGIATDYTSNPDKRVRTASSCMICHIGGINRAGNSLNDLIVDHNVKLKAADKNYGLDLKRAYLNPDFGLFIEDDRELFKRSIGRCNPVPEEGFGLTPEINHLFYTTMMEWYDQDLDVEQAALECGFTVDEFKKRIINTPNGTLGSLINGGSVPRESWDDVSNSYFAQAMITLLDLKAQPATFIPSERLNKPPKPESKPEGFAPEETIPTASSDKPEEPQEEEPSVPPTSGEKYKVIKPVTLFNEARTPIIGLTVGYEVEVYKKEVKPIDGYIYVKYNDKEGYVQKNRLEKVE